ncbi:hypothetical protein C0991_008406 [Blastosporella zonata]|nr:hypothetical protein C0991_008406 [Blastosporella zonata]
MQHPYEPSIIVWFQHYRKENFQDDSLPPGKWTKRESKQDWRVTHLRSRGDRSPPNAFSRGSGYSSPISHSGYQTPREIKEEQWKAEAEAASRPGKVEMRGMYKELGGRKSRSKTKFGAPGTRDKGGWEEGVSLAYVHIIMTSGARSLVSYDDITLPYQSQSSPAQNLANKPPPTKKRKWNKNNSKGRNHDDTRSTATSFHPSPANNAGQPSASYVKVVGDESMDEDGRDLTHDEIWDDSALIDAWNAATEEYEAYNGPDKGWKKDPIHTSPLWYNVPSTIKKATQSTLNGHYVPPIAESTQEEEEENSHPLNFDTFTPSHDPSLAMTMPAFGPDSVPQSLSDAPGPMEEMSNSPPDPPPQAQRRLAQGKTVQQGEEESFDEDHGCEDGCEHGEEEDEEEEDAFVSTQR